MQFQTEFHDISKWISQEWNKPQKGSRPNNIYENPQTGELYYFKQSKLNFQTEIWSEVIASKIGQILGFNVLDYNIGMKNNIIGCLSKSMVNTDIGEELYHGVDIMNDYIDDFEISAKPICSFQDWETICLSNRLFNNFISFFIEIILFDAIIGNTDRHTENWAFIRSLKFSGSQFSKIFGATSFRSFFSRPRSGSILKKSNLRTMISHEFQVSLIYDSGSCLGREIPEEKIEVFLMNDAQILDYIQKGKSEIKWNKEEYNLFEIVKKVKQSYPKIIEEKTNIIFQKNTETIIDDLVNCVDLNVNKENKITLLSLQRKRLIKQLLKNRIKYLQRILQND